MMKRQSGILSNKNQIDETELTKYHMLGKFSMKKINEKVIDLSDEVKITLEIKDTKTFEYTLIVKNEDNIGKFKNRN